jgi:hypothetical protein
MVVRSTTYDYEQSSESGRERHLDVPYTGLTDATPTLGDPAQVTGLPAGSQVTGTIVTVDATDAIAIINTADGAVYRHNVRSVTAYNPGVAENAWRVLNIGDEVWYDHSASMPAGCYLSLAPTGTDTVANTPFGHIVMMQDETVLSYPKGTGLTPGDTHVCAVQQL